LLLCTGRRRAGRARRGSTDCLRRPGGDRADPGRPPWSRLLVARRGPWPADRRATRGDRRRGGSPVCRCWLGGRGRGLILDLWGARLHRRLRATSRERLRRGRGSEGEHRRGGIDADGPGPQGAVGSWDRQGTRLGVHGRRRRPCSSW